MRHTLSRVHCPALCYIPVASKFNIYINSTAMYVEAKSYVITYYTIYGGLLSHLWFVFTIIHGSRKEVQVIGSDTVGRITLTYTLERT